MRVYTPLRYPGGKSKLTPFLKEVFRTNKLLDGTYIEPYAGGAAVAFALLADGYAGKIIINDVDLAIYSFWHSLLSETDRFIEKIEKTQITITEWEKQKEIYSSEDYPNTFDLGFATFFLNRTNYSGVIKGGVIGGKGQQGKYAITARFNKNDLIDRIRFISNFRNRISVYNSDALDLLSNLQVGEKSLIYLDPPYYVKGSCLYRNYYTHKDHEQIAEKVNKITTPCLVTYDNVEAIRQIYKQEQSFEFELRYNANKTRCKGSEILIYRNLKLPDNINI